MDTDFQLKVTVDQIKEGKLDGKIAQNGHCDGSYRYDP